MTSNERLRELQFISDLWLKEKERAKKHFDELVKLRHSAVAKSPYDIELLNRRIDAEDHAVSEYHKAHTFANSLVDRAKAGEDV
jgi:hypothetical protein